MHITTSFIYNKSKEYGAYHGTHSNIYGHALEGIDTAHVYQLSDGGRDGDHKRGLHAFCGCVFVISVIYLIPARILKNLWRIKVTDPISCEGWDTGKPFLGVPSKFVVINEDGEEVGTLDELIPLLILGANNLSDLENPVEARNNLGVYSKEEVDSSIETAVETATPQATSTVKGQAKIATTAIAQAGTNDTDIVTPKKLRDGLNASGVMPIYALRTWGIIKGTSTPASLVKGVNVASIVDEGVGQYKVTFTTPMPDINYLILLGTTTYSLSDIGTYGAVRMNTKTVNGFSIICGAQNTADIPELYFGVTY